MKINEPSTRVDNPSIFRRDFMSFFLFPGPGLATAFEAKLQLGKVMGKHSSSLFGTHENKCPCRGGFKTRPYRWTFTIKQLLMGRWPPVNYEKYGGAGLRARRPNLA
jgi:hypothetical protein